LGAVVAQLPDSAVRDRIEDLLPSQRLPPQEIARRFGATGHVVDTVPLALFRAQSIARQALPALLADAIAAGGDTDTVASIAGQIAGAAIGRHGIPDEALSDIEGIEEVIRIAEQFAGFATRWSAH
jgi:ADP-ribosylglycohydrolase